MESAQTLIEPVEPVERHSKRSRTEFPSLEHLFGSKTRAQLLVLFFGHSEQCFFVRELAREIDTQLHAVRRELENLELLGLIEAVEEDLDAAKTTGGRHKYYRAMTHSPLFLDLQSLLKKARLFLERSIAEHLKNLGSFVYVAITGRLIDAPDITTDLLLVGEVNLKQLEIFVRNLSDHVGFEVNFTILSPEEFRYRREMTDRFLYSILEGQRTVLIDQVSDNKNSRL